MFVTQLIGRQANSILDMPYAEALACIDAGTARRATEAEIDSALDLSTPPTVIVPPEELMAGYRTEPALSGGFDVFDAGGVKISGEDPLHNQIAARDFVLAHARRARNIPDLFQQPSDGEVGGGDGEETGYADLTVDQLREKVEERKLDHANAKVKDDWIKLLEHDDKVQKALADRDFDALTVADMERIAEEKKLDLGKPKNKAETVAAFAKAYQA